MFRYAVGTRGMCYKFALPPPHTETDNKSLCSIDPRYTTSRQSLQVRTSVLYLLLPTHQSAYYRHVSYCVYHFPVPVLVSVPPIAFVGASKSQNGTNVTERDIQFHVPVSIFSLHCRIFGMTLSPISGNLVCDVCELDTGQGSFLQGAFSNPGDEAHIEKRGLLFSRFNREKLFLPLLG